MLDTYEKEKRVDPDQVLYLKPAEERQFTSSWNHTIFISMAWVFSLILLVAAVLFIFHSVDGTMNEKKKMATLQALAAKNKTPKTVKSVRGPKEPVREATTSVRTSAESPKAAPRMNNSVGSEWLRSVEQGDFPKLSKKLPLRLTIEAIDNVWLRVTSDGKVLFQTVLKRGTSESWTATQVLEVWTGNSSNMSLTINGTSIGSPGKGVIKKMLVSHDGVKIGS